MPTGLASIHLRPHVCPHHPGLLTPAFPPESWGPDLVFVHLANSWTSWVSLTLMRQPQPLRRAEPPLPVPAGLHAIWPHHPVSVFSPARAQQIPKAWGNSTTEMKGPRWGLPFHRAQEGRAGFVVEGDDDAGGRQVRRIGHGWATEKRAERSEGSCESDLRAGLSFSLAGLLPPEARRGPWASTPMHTPLRPPSLESLEGSTGWGTFPGLDALYKRPRALRAPQSLKC